MSRSLEKLSLIDNVIRSLQSIDRSTTSVIISAFPVSRRRKDIQWLKRHTNYQHLGQYKPNDGSSEIAQKTCAKFGIRITEAAESLLVKKTQGNERLIAEEITKIDIYYANKKIIIDESMINQLVPDDGKVHFFEVIEIFYTNNLPGTLVALRHYFLEHSEPRSMIAGFQSRNRLMIQMRVLLDTGDLMNEYNQLTKENIKVLGGKYRLDSGLLSKSTYNVFSQNPWYLGKIATSVQAFRLRQLINVQIELKNAFETLLKRPNEQLAIMERFAVCCLSST